MNNAVKAVRITHGVVTEYTAFDCKILNKVAALIIKFGAISAERLAKLSKFQMRTVLWALWHLGCEETTMQLWVMPGL